MSLLTNQYIDSPDPCFEYGVPTKLTVRRRFFQSSVRWDEVYERVLVGSGDPALGFAPRSMSLTELMESGGRAGSVVRDGLDEDWDDNSML